MLNIKMLSAAIAASVMASASLADLYQQAQQLVTDAGGSPGYKPTKEDWKEISELRADLRKAQRPTTLAEYAAAVLEIHGNSWECPAGVKQAVETAGAIRRERTDKLEKGEPVPSDYADIVEYRSAVMAYREAEKAEKAQRDAETKLQARISGASPESSLPAHIAELVAFIKKNRDSISPTDAATFMLSGDVAGSLEDSKPEARTA